MYKDNAWHHLSAGKANILKTLDIDGDNQEDIVGNFPEYGTWIFQDKNRDYSNTEIHGWEKITGSPATVITTADVNSDGTDAVIGAYEGYGTWLYHGPNKKWYLLSTGMAENLTPFDFDGDNETDIIGSYGSGGTWIFQNKNKDYSDETKHGWIKITWVGGNPITTADIDNNKKEEPIGSYEGYGVWVYKQ